MAKLVLKDPFISLAANDLSDDFMAVTINPTADTQESTAFGDDWRDYEGGLRQYDLSFDFNQDYDAGALDATVWPLFGTKVAFRGSAQIGGPSSCKSQLDRDVHHQRIPADRRQHRGSDHRNSDRPGGWGAPKADGLVS